MQLRPYQEAALDALNRYFEECTGNPIIVLPTGSGKSLIIAEFIKRSLEAWPETRILVLTHMRELIAQDYKELISYWPDAPAGIYSAGLNKRDIGARILFAGIQSIHSKAYRVQRVDLVLVDEAHLIPRKSNTTYRKFLNDLKQINPYLKVIGLTASPYRTDSGMLHVGDDAMFTDIAYEANVADLIAEGYLARPVSISGIAQIDTTGVAVRGGDFVAGALESVADEPETVSAIVDEICQYGASRRGWIVFGCGVKHCNDLAEAIKERGYIAETIFGDTPTPERDYKINAFKRQQIRCLVSMNVLTTGFNAQHVDLIALARPTKSTGLYIQMVGRGTRLFPGKENCLVLDNGGNIARHGPIDAPIVKDKKKVAEPDDPPMKECPECGTRNYISVRECVQCGYAFPDVQHKVTVNASQLSILQGAIRTSWIPVTSVTYHRHKNRNDPTKPDTICVTYVSGLDTHREYLCPLHSGFARSKFMAWWIKRMPQITPPTTIEGVLELRDQIPIPTEIAVRPSGKYCEVIGAKL